VEAHGGQRRELPGDVAGLRRGVQLPGRNVEVVHVPAGVYFVQRLVSIFDFEF
jgi:hypothetical protein